MYCSYQQLRIHNYVTGHAKINHVSTNYTLSIKLCVSDKNVVLLANTNKTISYDVTKLKKYIIM